MMEKFLLPNSDLLTPITISLIGGGGKTSLTFWLAQQMAAQGHKVLVSTTTKMFVPTSDQISNLVINSDNEKLLSLLQSDTQIDSHSITYCASKIDYDKDKVLGVDPELINHIKNLDLFTVLIIEADGARRRPIKAPLGHEPCIPSSTDIVIAVTGGSGTPTY
ncbi:putative selenium-dependent hydroxylase accessory protein YqeC [Vibrio sp. SS-MA-C1-2]|uniref:selenium cofactor biosynthesis protein YqeC n=1 Tax=Vibrio sp. SS-MA-C1-2 TaxID=2908646 RepID=UPI001F42A5F2|nr:selenium cofactor biosynthesis protein YqeC [Vibrio sp. SS-MA-C1-2]UJF18340.1 putative selenium-dependent hydroxylase accessory protein YqeC [Vibrio sp. SS-MA-C1-2]